jgi:DNA polymerase-1
MDFKSALIRTKDEWLRERARFEAAPVVSFDFETVSLDDHTVTGLSLGIPPVTSEGFGYAVYLGFEDDCDLSFDRDVKPWLEILFADPQREIVGVNLKFDTMVLRNNGVENVPGNVGTARIFDCMVASWMLSNDERKHGIEAAAERFLHTTVVKDLGEIRKLKATNPDLYWKEMLRYGYVDATIPLQLRSVMIPMLHARNLEKAFKELEMPCVGVTTEMEMAGIPMDTVHLQAIAPGIEEAAKAAQTEVFKYAGREFNIGSPVQLSEVLYEGTPPLLSSEGLERGKSRGKKNPKPGAYPTGSEILKYFDHPIAKAVLDWRGSEKLLRTYVYPLIEFSHSHGGRIYTSWRQTGTTTGRYATSDPLNVQNWPRKKGLIRKAAKASPGFVIVASDYSQIELRLMAHQSCDPVMIAAYLANEDLHRRTAAFLLRIPESEVTKEQRHMAKAVNFGFLYGMSAQSFVEYAFLNYGVTVSPSDAEAFRKSFFLLYRGVAEYHNYMRDFVWERGYAENVIGERRYLPEHRSSDNYKRWLAWSEGVNYTIQGSAAALIKIAMRNIYRDLIRPHGYKRSTRYGRLLTCWGAPSLAHEVRLVMQVHDELVFEVRQEIAVPFSKWLRHKMETAVTAFKIPIIAEAGIGPDVESAKV